MAMGNDSTTAHWQEKKDIARFIVTNDLPWVASFQEMCRDQFDALKSDLDPLGYHVVGFWPWSVNNEPQCHSTKLGSAVFIQGTVISGFTTLIKHSLQDPPSNGQDFAMVCRLAQNVGFQYFGCSIHSVPSPRDPTSGQVTSSEEQDEDSFTWFTGSTWDNYSTVIAGDFNHRNAPGDTSFGLSEWGFIAEEMHLPTQIQTHTQSGNPEKIDFAFAGKDRFGRGAVEACTWQSNSDHKYCGGNFTI